MAINSKRILWIDDQPSNNKNLADTLTEVGYELTYCGNLMEGFMHIQSGSYDLVILDDYFPRNAPDDFYHIFNNQGSPIGGLDLLGKLRLLDPNIPVIVYGDSLGLARVDYLRQVAEKYGVHPNLTGSFSKPIMPSELAEKIKKTLS